MHRNFWLKYKPYHIISLKLREKASTTKFPRMIGQNVHFSLPKHQPWIHQQIYQINRQMLMNRTFFNWYVINFTLATPRVRVRRKSHKQRFRQFRFGKPRLWLSKFCKMTLVFQKWPLWSRGSGRQGSWKWTFPKLRFQT